MAAVGCVTALSRILRSCKSNADLLSRLEALIYPVIEHSLTSNGLESLEEAADCLNLLIYYRGGLTGQVSKQLWKLYP